MTTKAKRKAGRPTKLDPAAADRIVSALQGGNYRNVAAEWAGITPGTLRQWMRRGRSNRKADAPFRDFRRRVMEAERGAEIFMVAKMMKAAEEDPRHALMWLERKFPERWGRREQVRIGNTQGETFKTEGMADEVGLLRKLVEMGKRLDVPDPEGEATAAKPRGSKVDA